MLLLFAIEMQSVLDLIAQALAFGRVGVSSVLLLVDVAFAAAL